MNDDDLEHHEEEFRRKIELEEEEKKLEQSLELQQRIEKEAKDCQLKHVADGLDVQEHIRLPMQVGIQT